MTTSNAREMTCDLEFQAEAVATAVEDAAVSYAGTVTGHKLESLLNTTRTRNLDGSYSFHLPKHEQDKKIVDNSQKFVELLSDQEEKLGEKEMSTFLDFIFCFNQDIKKKRKQKRKQKKKQKRKQKRRKPEANEEGEGDDEEDEQDREKGDLNGEESPKNVRNYVGNVNNCKLDMVDA